MQIMTINAGSSSIKFDLFEGDGAPARTLTGVIDNIGLATPSQLTVNGKAQPVEVADHTVAAKILSDWIGQQNLTGSITAIAHRIVHGGPTYNQPTRIDETVISELQKLVGFDPEHMPVEIELIQKMGDVFPNTLQIACFDTGFHNDLPTVARLLPIPRKYEKQGIRRYGFHGLSYASIMRQLGNMGEAKGRIVIAHLGNGASLAAIKDGVSIDTTMALTPAAGIPMSSRSGDLDPGVALYLATAQKQTAEEFNYMVNYESGLLGMSELSADMKTLLEAEADNPMAKDAIDVFCYQVRKNIGALAAALGGIDTLVFTGGIGEAAPKVRAQVCAGLEFLGIELDDMSNQNNDVIISKHDSKVMVHVQHTDEATAMAEQVQTMIKTEGNHAPQE